MQAKVEALYEAGQSIWLDFLSRELLETGELSALIDEGIRGITSNPSIFHEAITQGARYDSQLGELAINGDEVTSIYEAMAVADIQQATDMLHSVYESSEGMDGFVSLEADPRLADDTEATIEEILYLHEMVDRPNAMFKVPATKQGYAAVERLTGEGININITLMFSIEQYREVAAAYQSGLERLLDRGRSPDEVTSVASFFVSRMDSKVDPLLAETKADDLLGTIAIANAKLAYREFQRTLESERWQGLEQQGARVQRVLWGSTSTKNPDYSDTRYVDRLIGPHTINTMPRDTFEAFKDHGSTMRSVDTQLEQAQEDLERLDELGIDLDQVTDELLDEGLQKFTDSMVALLEAIEHKAEQFRAGAEQVAPAER